MLEAVLRSKNMRRPETHPRAILNSASLPGMYCEIRDRIVVIVVSSVLQEAG
jgi:hypothetical protein